MLKILIKAFKASKGRMPNALEMLQLRFKAAQQAGKGEVIEFPPSAITDWTKPRPTTGKKAGVTELDDPLINEFARTETLASPTRIKQGFSTQSKLNSWAQNQKWVKDFIGRKNREFNSLIADDDKKVLDMFEVQIKKHMPKEPKAYGGIAGMLGERTGLFCGGPPGVHGRETGGGYSDRERHERRQNDDGPTGITTTPTHIPKDIKPVINVPDKDGSTGFLSNVRKANREKYLNLLKKYPLEEYAKAQRFDETIIPEEEQKFLEPYGADIWRDMHRVRPDYFLERGPIPGVATGPYWQNPPEYHWLAGGGIAGMLGEPTYQDDNHRVPFKDAKSVEGPMGPQNFYDIGFGSILDDVMRDSPKKGTWTEKDLENIWNILQGEHDVENWKDELMFRFGRHDPDKKSHLFLELGKDKKGIGWKKQIDFNKWLMGKADGGRVPYDSGNMVLPKEKPTALNWLDTLDSKAALNTLGPRTYFDMVAKFATEAKDKGDLSEKEYMEIMQPFFGRGGETLTRKIDEEREYLDEYQTGGRVPLGKGKSALQGLAKLMDEFFPGTTKIGKTSKPMAEKTQLKKAIADFQKREKKSRQLTDDEYDDFVDELGGEDHLEAYTFDGTVGDAQRILKEQKDYHDYMYQQYKMGKLEPKAGEVNRGRLNLLRERADEAGSSGDPKLFSRDDYDELEYLEDHFKQVDKEESFQFAERIKEAKANKKSPWYTDPKTLTPEEQLRREFPGITDENINLILTDKDPQRIAEVKATLHEALKMQQKGMGHEEIIKIFKKKPTKHASGGLAGMLGE